MTNIVEFDPFAAQLAEFRKRYDAVVYDLSIPAQEKQARSDRYAIGKVIADLDRRHKEIKAPLAERVSMIDGARKRIKDELLAVQEKIKSQIEAHEARIRAKVDAITALQFQDHETPSPAQIAERLEKVAAIDLESGYDDCKEDAALALVQTRQKLTAMHRATLEREELERLRREAAERERAEREERIRAEAEAKARAEAERKAKDAEQKAARELAEAKAATERAERAAIEAAEKAKHDAKVAAERAAKTERERIEREQREAAQKAEAERGAEEARKAKAEHRAAVIRDAEGAFVLWGLTQPIAARVVELIAGNHIPNIRVEY